MDSNEEKVLTSFAGDEAGGVPIFVHVKNGRIIRIRPLVFEDDEAKPWKLEIGDKTFTPPKKDFGAPWDLTLRRRTYNEERVKYPLKRVGFEPGGKNDNSNRGNGEFVRISWDEALDIVEFELKRIKEKYGPSAFFTHTLGHRSSGLVNGSSLIRRVFDFWGGHTELVRNPDSWEGWYWGAEHVWGFSGGNGNCDSQEMLEDTMNNSELSVFWAYDLEQSCMMMGQDAVLWLRWLKDIGKKMIFIAPDLNYTAGTKADKWIPILPGTDAALAAAIAKVWIDDDTYDKEYVQSHCIGFEKWKDYVLGNDDGVPKTPEWAEEITGVQACITRALAREWGSKRTHLCIRHGGACRTPYATEWARMMVFLQAMQGLGRPGVSIHPIANTAPAVKNIVMPIKKSFPMLNLTAKNSPGNSIKQVILQTMIPRAILNPPISWYGGATGAPTEKQFQKFEYPLPGHSEIHMIWWDTVSSITNWNSTSEWAKAYRSPKIEFTVAQTQFFENDALFADIILPACTQLETEDFCYPDHPMIMGHGGDYNNFAAVYMKECIKPLYESKTDYEICRLVAERLGVEQEFSEGRTVDDWIRSFYEVSSLPEFISYEDFKKKGYYVFKFPDEWERRPALKEFYDTASGLSTPTGKIEFFSQRLADNFPDDDERPPVPRYIADGETHQESLNSPRATSYPLLMETPHARYRFHSQHESIPWLWDIPTHKIVKNGFPYDTIWMSPKDAEQRNVRHGDVVRVFNERGSCLGAAYITERMMPSVVRMSNGTIYKPVANEKYKGLPMNMITPLNTTSRNAYGMVVNAFLVQVEKWEGKD